MYEVLGKWGGVKGIFHTKWKAKDAMEQLWNGEKMTIRKVAVSELDEKVIEVRSYQIKRL
jgi:hypothetical protein